MKPATCGTLLSPRGRALLVADSASVRRVHLITLLETHIFDTTSYGVVRALT
jgi:hypothetical protein